MGKSGFVCTSLLEHLEIQDDKVFNGLRQEEGRISAKAVAEFAYYCQATEQGMGMGMGMELVKQWIYRLGKDPNIEH